MKGRSGLLVVVGAVAAAVLALILALGLMFGLDGGGDDGTTATATTRPSRVPTTTVPAAAPRTPGADVTLTATGARRSSAPAPVLDSLDDGDVLRVRVRDLRAGSRSRVRQCVRVADSVSRCTNEFPIQVGAAGVAYFQYQVNGDRLRCGADASCVIAVSDDDGATALAYTVFGETAPPPASVRVTPAGPYRPDARVVVDVAPLRPGAQVGVAFCSAECQTTRSVTAGADGRARASLTLGSACRRDDPCVIRVDGLATRDAVVTVRFRAGPAARYDAWRLTFGLALAVALLLLAREIVRRTDWHVPTEAATPALDEATL